MPKTISAEFFGVDKYGRPNFPPFSKIWYEDGGYKGYIYIIEEGKFYFNDIPVEAEFYWDSLYALLGGFEILGVSNA